MKSSEIISIKHLSLQYRPRSWPFAVERRAEIDAHFERVREDRPKIWNGQVLMMHHHRLDRDTLEGAFLQTDFASFIAWRDWGFPQAGLINCFSMGALRTSDGAWLMGEMGAHTSAAGKIYFPAGTPDPDDIVNGVVDLAGNMIREVAEETGLGPGDFTEAAAWHCVADDVRMALIKVLQARERADVLRRRILEHLESEATPELADIHIVRSRRDYDSMMPGFVTTFLDHAAFSAHTRS
ncbi:MAG: NUDIX hydrolase [Rhizobiales bacterium]|nr:NUDIX hydrolase [Hyphomicrobiales bacterium]